MDGGPMMEAGTHSPMPSFSVLERVGSMPNSHDVLQMVGHADGDVECPQCRPALAFTPLSLVLSMRAKASAKIHLLRLMRSIT